MSNKLRFGIIGCGGIAKAKHLPALLADSRVEIIGLCDLTEQTQALKQEFDLKDVKLYEDYKELLKNPVIDCVNICTPNETHASITIAALEAGKHVMCEKPMATNLEDAKEMIATAKKTGKMLTICANNRFRLDSWTLKQLCARGDLGDIYFAKAHAIRRRGVPTWGVFIDKQAQGGGPVIDIGVHALDLALWMMDNYSVHTVLACTFDHIGKVGSPANPYGNWDPQRFFVEDSGFAMITMKNKAAIILESSWALNIRDEKTAKVTLCGTKAGADMDGGLIINGEDNGNMYDQKIILEPPRIPFYKPPVTEGPVLEMRLWLDSVLEQKPPVVVPEQMFVVSSIIQAIYLSAQTGESVRF